MGKDINFAPLEKSHPPQKKKNKNHRWLTFQSTATSVTPPWPPISAIKKVVWGGGGSVLFIFFP